MTKKTSRILGDTKNVLIVEASLSGHRGVYLSWIVNEARKYSVNITLLLPDTDIEKIRYEKISETITNTKIIWMKKEVSSSKLQLRQVKYWMWMKNSVAKVKSSENIDFVILPYLDYISHVVSILGSPFGNTKWCGIIMRPNFHYPSIGIKTEKIKYKSVQRFLFLRLLAEKTLCKCLTIDATLKKYIDSMELNIARKLRYMPDPTSLSCNAEYLYKQKYYKRDNKLFVILVFGGITFRKGIDALVHAVADKQVPGNIKILLAGQQSNEVIKYLRTDEALSLRKNGRLEEWNRYLSKDEELDAYIQADIVWVGYRSHSQMSGVVVTAGMLGKPVIATEQGLIGMLTKNNNSGLTIDIGDQESIVKSINKLADDNEMYVEFSRCSRERYCYYTTENAGKILWEDIIKM